MVNGDHQPFVGSMLFWAQASRLISKHKLDKAEAGSSKERLDVITS
jgi:hypothetical protein